MKWLYRWLFPNLVVHRDTDSRVLFLLNSQIHGSHYYDCLQLVKNQQLNVGEVLSLQREPSNEYDEDAIEIYTRQRKKLGYIPKQHNRVIAALMDQNCRISATIQAINTDAWEPVTIRVEMQLPSQNR